MNFELRFTDKEITAWGGMGLMKRMLDHMGFDEALMQSGLPQLRSSSICRSNSPPPITRLQRANGKSGLKVGVAP